MTIGIGIKTTGGVIMVYDMYYPDAMYQDKKSDPHDKLSVTSYKERMEEGVVLGIAGEYNDETKKPKLDFLERASQDKGFMGKLNERTINDYQSLVSLKDGKLPPDFSTLKAIKGLVESAKDSGNQFMIGTFDGRLIEVNGKNGIKESNLVVNGSGSDLVKEYVEQRYRDDMTIEEGMELAKEAINIALSHKPTRSGHDVRYRGYSMKIIREDSIEEIVDPLAESVELDKKWVIGAESEPTRPIPTTRIIKINKKRDETIEDGEIKTARRDSNPFNSGIPKRKEPEIKAEEEPLDIPKETDSRDLGDSSHDMGTDNLG